MKKRYKLVTREAQDSWNVDSEIRRVEFNVVTVPDRPVCLY